LLFLGSTGSARERIDWEITYRFEASQNVSELTIPGTGIQVSDKRGHDYMWVRFKKEEAVEGGKPHLVQVPEFAYVSRVYREADFKSVLGF
jgi:hypothetical protein